MTEQTESSRLMAACHDSDDFCSSISLFFVPEQFVCMMKCWMHFWWIACCCFPSFFFNNRMWMTECDICSFLFYNFVDITIILFWFLKWNSNVKRSTPTTRELFFFFAVWDNIYFFLSFYSNLTLFNTLIEILQSPSLVINTVSDIWGIRFND